MTWQDFFKLLSSVGASADHLESPALAAELARVLYDGMDLMLKVSIDWGAKCIATPPGGGGGEGGGGDMMEAIMAQIAKAKAGVAAMPKTHGEMRAAVELAAATSKVPLFYVPVRSGGFLLAMEAGADEAARDAAKGHAEALGFEGIDGAPGCFKLPVPTDKDMMLLIDVSGSMHGQRIKAATDNALKIYDKFTNDDDYVGLVWFDHMYKEQFPLTKGARRATRSKINDTRNAVAGGTAFYDALIKAVQVAPKSSNSYLVALTDGEDKHSLMGSFEAAKKAISESEWRLFIIGLQVDPTTRKVCESLAKACPDGQYVHAANAGADLDAAFATVAAQFVMPKVKSADAAASGGGARGV